jgi:hypothetical protein
MLHKSRNLGFHPSAESYVDAALRVLDMRSYVRIQVSVDVEMNVTYNQQGVQAHRPLPEHVILSSVRDGLQITRS